MIKLINLSRQGFNIFLKTDNGSKSFWLTPKETILIAENTVSSQIKKMVNKNILKIERV